MSSARQVTGIESARLPPRVLPAPIPRRESESPAPGGATQKASLVIFEPERFADENWQIRVFLPTAKIDCEVRFDSEAAARQWIAAESSAWAEHAIRGTTARI